MPSNKTLSIIIVCLAVVTSIWLISKSQTPSTSAESNNTSANSVSSYKYQDANSTTSNDWQKILTTVATSSEPVTDLTQSGDNGFGTTLTDQMARDFMSQYLLAKKNGGTITAQDAQSIASNVLSNPNYTQTSGAVYVQSNLNVINSADVNTVTQYRDTVNLILKNRSTQVKNGPVTLLDNAMSSNSPTPLSKLNAIISVANGMIQDLLAVKVPKDAVGVHLELLNATSNVVNSLQAMAVAFDDPVRSYLGVSQYNQNMLNFQNALTDLNNYFIRKLGSAT